MAITTAVIRRRWRRIQVHKPQTSAAYFTTCIAIKRAETTDQVSITRRLLAVILVIMMVVMMAVMMMV